MSDNFFKNHGSSPGRVCIPPRPNSPVSHKSVTPAPFFGESVTSHRPAEPVRCLIGIQFCWSNGERLDDYAWKLTLDDGSLICDQLGTKSYISQFIPSASHSVQLVPGFDAQQVLGERRAELQKALQDILAAERAEAQRLKAIQDQRGPATQFFYDQLALGKGFFYAAWGLVKTLDEFDDVVNPFNQLSLAVTTAWNTPVQRGQSWFDTFNERFKAEQHRELVEALGFDPAAISREDLAKAYETVNYIADDEQSVRLLKGFALEYLQILNRETLLEVAGGVLFEIVFAALLILITGGTGLAVRGAALTAQGAALAARLSPLLQALGQSLHKLGLSLKIARVHKDGRAVGTDSKPQTVVVERPVGVLTESLTRPKRVLPQDKQGESVSNVDGAKAGNPVIDAEKTALDRIAQSPKGPDLSSKAPNTVLNTQAVDSLNAGKLPGTPIGGPGTPREMPASPNPSATAENFVNQIFGDSQINKKPIPGCDGCWRGQTADGSWVTYRPAGQASAATSSTTATVEINGPGVNALNANQAGKGQVLKFKFPVKSEVMP